MQEIYIGNDVVFMPSFIQSCTNNFIKKVYSEKELKYCEQFTDPYLRYASTWAAKEAQNKAIRQMDENITLSWKDIEIIRHKPQGQPTVLSKKIQKLLHFSLSITHHGDYVWAVVICYPVLETRL